MKQLWDTWGGSREPPGGVWGCRDTVEMQSYQKEAPGEDLWTCHEVWTWASRPAHVAIGSCLYRAYVLQSGLGSMLLVLMGILRGGWHGSVPTE